MFIRNHTKIYELTGLTEGSFRKDEGMETKQIVYNTRLKTSSDYVKCESWPYNSEEHPVYLRTIKWLSRHQI